MELSYRKLRRFAFGYVCIPVIIFAIGWLKPIWAGLVVLGCAYCLFTVFYAKKDKETESKEGFRIPISWIIIAVVIALVWTWQSGIGGLWAQSKDYPWRNAIFRDLILRDWPVQYEVYNGALVYYIGFWLLPAIFGKLALILGASAEAAFTVGNIFLLLWTTVGLLLLFLLIVNHLKCSSRKRFFFAVFLFIFFSGMDILGSIEPLGANLYHLEWWAEKYQYSSFTTCLFWVFNQSVIPWIVTICIFSEKSTRNYVFLGMMCLFSGPLPFLGVFVYCLLFGIEKTYILYREKNIKKAISNVLSTSNIISTVILFPVVGSYLLCNNAISAGNIRVSEEAAIVEETVQGTDYSGITTYLMFIAFEFLVYALLVLRKNYKKPVYYVTVVSLLVLPFMQVGYGYDFTMRVSIPFLFAIYLFCTDFVMSEKYVLKVSSEDDTIDLENCENRKQKEKEMTKQRNIKLLYVILLVCLVLGSITPAVEFYRGFRQVTLHGVQNPMSDYIYTLGGDGPYSHSTEDGSSYANFVTTNSEEQLFFKVFSKPLN